MRTMKLLCSLVIGLTTLTLTSTLFIPIDIAPVCLDIGVFNKTTNLCDCPPGKHGDGSLCCVDNADDLCTDKGDPVATSIFHQHFWTDFPCAHDVGTIIKTSNNGKVCEITVVQAGKIVHNGAIYNNHFLLQVRTTPLLGLGVNLNLKRIKLWGHFFHNPLLNIDVDIQLLSGFQSLTLDGNIINFKYNKNTRIWQIDGCGSSIIIRGVEGDDAIQRETPGVCIAAKRNEFKGDVCGKSSNYTTGPFRSQSERLLSELIISRSSNNSRDIEDDDIRPKCDEVATEFTKCSANDYPKAIEECGNVLIIGLERRCLVAELNDPLEVFRDCIAAFCGKSQEACDRLKNDKGVKKCYKGATQKCQSWIRANVGGK